jgi:hypothetical protein
LGGKRSRFGNIHKAESKNPPLRNLCRWGRLLSVSRKLRLQYPGAIYHVMSRGDHREDIFADSQDRQLFLDTLEQACAKTDWQIHAFYLLSNHFQLVIERPRPTGL